ncbi:MAG: carbonic anhydrase [Candidatus Eremiobacteraeota bacterium]|nr:carbonic anhydrase [Candidatus Eremiobacteraeota bacterium]
MNKKFLKTIGGAALGAALLLTPVVAEEAPPRRERVLTQAEQDALTPESVLETLQEGNQRFVAGTVTKRDHSAMVRQAANGQFPKAVILSCLDSRIPVEDVFDRGIGDIFVARVAGNFVNTDILGSMEFGCAAAGAKVILVLGHGSCGAVVGTIDNVELGNLTATLQNIRPAVNASTDFAGEQASSNREYVERVTEENVRLNVEAIRQRSPLLRKMEEEGKIKIVGAMYNMATGEIEFLK